MSRTLLSVVLLVLALCVSGNLSPVHAQLTFKAIPTPPKLVFTPTVVTLQAQVTALQAQMAAEKIQLLSAQSGQAQAVAAEAALSTQIAALDGQIASLRAQLAAGNSSPPGTFGAAYTNATGHLVFAHYVMSAQDYGATLAGYERDIRDAEAAGIDGFALNIGTWSGSYLTDTALMFQAAANVSPTGQFKLFFSADEPGILPGSDIVSMLSAYASSASLYPNYWRYAGKPVLSTYGGTNGSAALYHGYWNAVFNSLAGAGITPYFLPMFNQQNYSGGGAGATTTTLPGLTSNITSVWTGNSQGNINGLFHAPVTGPGASADEEIYASVLHGMGLTWMSSVSPQYWAAENSGKPSYEYFGFESLVSTWNSIINTQHPDWVECFTWNDFAENTYLSPIDDVAKYWPYSLPFDPASEVPGYMTSHSGYTKLNSYFIQWYKTGVPPLISKDVLFWCYRTHPKAAVASLGSEVAPTSIDPNTLDDIYVTTLTGSAGATLTVTFNGATRTFAAPAGVGSFRVPFNLFGQSSASPSFSLSRNGAEECSGTDKPIVKVPATYNFGNETGYVVSQ